MSAQLVALDGGLRIVLDKPVMLIGRHPECDIQIDSSKISRRHCCIARVSDYLLIRDLGSTNGIRINGSRVAEGRLADGDELQIGGSHYRVVWETQPGLVQPAVQSAGPINPIEDDLLEACDEPVPLAEPGKARPGAPRVAPKISPPVRPPEKESPILPDVLELAQSDIFPNIPPQKS